MRRVAAALPVRPGSGAVLDAEACPPVQPDENLTLASTMTKRLNRENQMRPSQITASAQTAPSGLCGALGGILRHAGEQSVRYTGALGRTESDGGGREAGENVRRGGICRDAPVGRLHRLPCWKNYGRAVTGMSRGGQVGPAAGLALNPGPERMAST